MGDGFAGLCQVDVLLLWTEYCTTEYVHRVGFVIECSYCVNWILIVCHRRIIIGIVHCALCECNRL